MGASARPHVLGRDEPLLHPVGVDGLEGPVMTTPALSVVSIMIAVDAVTHRPLPV